MCSAINFYLGNSSWDNPAGSCEQDALLRRELGCSKPDMTSSVQWLCS